MSGTNKFFQPSVMSPFYFGLLGRFGPAWRWHLTVRSHGALVKGESLGLLLKIKLERLPYQNSLSFC